SLARKEQEPAAVGVKLAMKDVPNLPAPAAPVAEAAPAARPATVAIAPAPETPLGRAKKAEVAAIPAATVAQPAGATAGPQVASNLAESNLRLAFQNAPSQAAQGSRRSQMRFTQIPLRRDSMVAERSQAAQQQVMASFQLEQDGDRIIIRDADGSTYEGQVQTAPAIESEKLADGKVAKTAQPTWDISTQAAGQQVFFTLSGTNRSLNQRVEFHGNLTLNQPWQRASGEPAREIGVMGAQQPGSAKEAAAPVVLRVQSPRMPSRVQGRARLGDGSELDINAISVGP
ncbi:MAG: hypothetical protein N2689_16260, partial [Verrucomicrobiae bacterium]|nr:hypothetical protein [Verrucomicrobiae bacterium]